MSRLLYFLPGIARRFSYLEILTNQFLCRQGKG
jgi:hypothetical protein